MEKTHWPRTYSYHDLPSASSWANATITIKGKDNEKSWVYTQGFPKQRVMCLRPSGFERINIELMCPAFSEISKLANEGKPEAEDYEFAVELSREMSNAYSNETSRRSHVGPILRRLLRSDVTGTEILGAGAGVTDGSTFLLKTQAMIANQEFKNEKGTGACDAYMENCNYYVTSYSKMPDTEKHCCPALLIEVVGQEIGISGGAWCAGFPCVQPLSANVPFLCTSQNAMLRLLQARLVLAIRRGFKSLLAWHLEKQTAPTSVQSQYPFQRSIEVDGVERTLNYVRFLAEGEGDAAGRTKPIFLAEMSISEEKKQRVVVKFTSYESYGTVPHKLLADKQMAPRLYGTMLIGSMKMIVMDYVEGDAWFGQEHAKTCFDSLKSAVNTLHENGYVHGDLRSPNIIVTNEKKVILLDFDWAGVEFNPENKTDEFAKYGDVLNPEVNWPEGAKMNGAITREHDLEMLRNLQVG